MVRFQPRDFIKAELRDDLTGEDERMWVVVDAGHSGSQRRLSVSCWKVSGRSVVQVWST